MNATSQDKRAKITLFVVAFACLLLFPVAFYYGVFGALAVISAAAALQHFLPVFRSRPDVCWGAGTMVRFRMSRSSRLVVGLWFVFITVHIILRGVLKMPGSPYYLAGHAAFALVVTLTRWLDRGRLVR
jgi:hypothetical protein